MTLRIITGGLQTTVQDLGRMGQQGKGIPVGGAMDRMALRLANVLVGNDDGAAARFRGWTLKTPSSARNIKVAKCEATLARVQRCGNA